MKRAIKKPAKAPAKAKRKAPLVMSEISRGSLIPILDGKAAVTFGATSLDGRSNGWICKPDGTRIERILAKDIADAEVRAKQLLDKGALA